MNKKLPFLLAAIVFTLQGFTQDTTGKRLDEVIITANKYPQKQTETGKVITVINREALQKMGGRTVGEILNTAAGVTIIGANNNLGTNQTISIRGASAGNVLLLLDGIPVNDPSVITNYFDLNFINPDFIERIEILKGGQSTLYGSDAVAGVINIISRQPPSNHASPYALLSAGSYGTFRSTAGLSGSTPLLDYNAGGSLLTTNGFSSAYDSAGNKNFDKDGFYERMVKGDVRFKLTKALSLKLFGNYTVYDADIDAAAFTDDADFIIKNKNGQVGAWLAWNGRNGTLHLNYHYNAVSRFYHDDSTYRSNPYSYFSKSNYTGRTHFAEMYRNFRWNGVELLAGIDYRYNGTDQDYFSFGSFGPYEAPHLKADMNQVSPYASLVFHKKGFTVEAGSRWNHRSEYNDNFTYTFNPSYLIMGKIKLFANLSSAFKTPTLYQLFDPFIGNRALNPETATVYEGGFEATETKGLHGRVTGFYRNTKNAIQYIITDPATFAGSYTNINRQKNYGAELEVDYQGSNWSVQANYTYTQGKTTSHYAESGNSVAKDTTYTNLYRVPKHAVNMVASYAFTKKWSISSLLQYRGNRVEPVYAAAPVKLDDYVTIDLSGHFSLNNGLRFFADFKNLTNKKYTDVLGYNSRRFNFDAGLAIQL